MNAENIAQVAKSTQSEFLDGVDLDRLRNYGPPLATELLKSLDVSGWHHLDAFDPISGQPAGSRTFEPGSWGDIEQWVRERITRFNLYFSANEPIPNAPSKKLGKENIASIRCVFVDIDATKDPTADFDLDQARLDQIVHSNASGMWPATLAINSGNGRQLIWRLREKLNAREFWEVAEDQGKAISRELSGDYVRNIDRILRLPGTLNIPTASKRKLGWSTRPTAILQSSSHRYDLQELARQVPPRAHANEPSNENFVDEARAELDAADLSEVTAELATRFANACKHHPRLDALWRGDKVGLFGSDASGSGFRASLARHMAEMGFDCVDYGRIVLSWGIHQIDADKIDPDTETGLRQLSRDWGRFGRPHSVAQWLDPASDAEPLFPMVGGDAKSSPAFDFDAATRVSIEDIDNIREKEFTLGTRFQPGAITLGVGPAGVSKSMFALLSAVAIATGRELTGELVSRSGPVLVFNAEDPSDEMRRRLKALISYYKLPADEVLARVRLLSGYDQHRLVLARRDDRHGPIRLGKDLNALADFVGSAGIVHVALDPLVALHRGLEENSASDMEQLMDGVRWLARSTGASIDLIHHTVKSRASTEQNAGVGDASRGSGAIFAAARSNYTLMQMAQTTGKELNLPAERVSQMVRLDDGKRNNTRRAARERWFEILSVLPNGEAVPGWHFDAPDRALRKRALESVGLHIPFDAAAQRRTAILNSADNEEQRRTALRSLIVATMDADEVDRVRIVQAYRDVRPMSETSARTAIDDVVPEGRNRAASADGDDVSYLLWRKRVGTKWVICREVCGQIVRPNSVFEADSADFEENGGVLG